jgi:hypothetical protein
VSSAACSPVSTDGAVRIMGRLVPAASRVTALVMKLSTHAWKKRGASAMSQVQEASELVRLGALTNR